MSYKCYTYNADFKLTADYSNYIFWVRSSYSNTIIWPFQKYYVGTEQSTWPLITYKLTVQEYTLLKLMDKVR